MKFSDDVRHFSKIAARSALLLLVTAACAPAYTTVTLKGDTADVNKVVFYEKGEVHQYVDTTFYNVPVDSISEVFPHCGNQTFSLSDSAKYIQIDYPSIESKKSESCLYEELYTLLILNFEEPITTIVGRFKRVQVSKDRKSITLPYLKDRDLSPTVEYSISTQPQESNYRLASGLDYFGLYADIPAAVGPAWFNGESGLKENRGYIINAVSLGFIFNRVRVASRISILDFEPAAEVAPDTSYTSLSSVSGELGLGYQVLNSDFFTITPSVMGSRRKFEFSDGDDVLDDVETDSFIAYGFNLCVDIKLQQLFRSTEKREEKKNEYLFLKVEGGWYPDLLENAIAQPGAVTYVSFAISGYIGVPFNTRRIKPIKR
ncbi:hypothetical protein O3Q51_09315 [Cryomorphaceae bacterium 1068]|nr:hypothetical protein [Cryomorphaceae bacterium 1068]